MAAAQPGPVTDVSPARWLVREITGFRGRVRDVVPVRRGRLRPSRRYEAFARVVPLPGERLPLALLRDVLAGHTRTDRCWFAVWDGWPAADAWRHAPTFHLPNRGFHLFTAALHDDVMVNPDDDRGPGLWWPDDRAWVVANEVDSDATYVAGSRPLVDELARTDGFRATEVGPDDPITIDS